MSFRFFAIPAHRVGASAAELAPEQMLAPEVPHHPGEVEQALSEAEMRDARAKDVVRRLLSRAPPYAPPAPGFGRSAVFALPPNDLPALLRLAHQLETLATQQSGERALVWVCSCGTRYAVPVALVRPVSIRCERCGKPLELLPVRSVGEEQLLDPLQAAVNARREKLAGFFREAMARGWAVMVCATPQ